MEYIKQYIAQTRFLLCALHTDKCSILCDIDGRSIIYCWYNYSIFIIHSDISKCINYICSLKLKMVTSIKHSIKIKINYLHHFEQHRSIKPTIRCTLSSWSSKFVVQHFYKPNRISAVNPYLKTNKLGYLIIQIFIIYLLINFTDQSPFNI